MEIFLIKNYIYKFKKKLFNFYINIIINYKNFIIFENLIIYNIKYLKLIIFYIILIYEEEPSLFLFSSFSSLSIKISSC